MVALATFAVLSIGAVSCGSDDEEEMGADSNSSSAAAAASTETAASSTSILVGTWMIQSQSTADGSYYEENGENGTWFYFSADGTGFEEDHFPDEPADRWPITWSYNETEKKLIVVDVEDPNDTYTDTYEVLSLDATTMKLRIYGTEETFVKVP